MIKLQHEFGCQIMFQQWQGLMTFHNTLFLNVTDKTFFLISNHSVIWMLKVLVVAWMSCPQRSQVFDYLSFQLVSVWGGIGVMALLEEICHRGPALMFQKTCAIPSVLVLPPACRLRCELPASSAILSLLHHQGLLTLWSCKTNRILHPISCTGCGFLSQQEKGD